MVNMGRSALALGVWRPAANWLNCSLLGLAIWIRGLERGSLLLALSLALQRSHMANQEYALSAFPSEFETSRTIISHFTLLTQTYSERNGRPHIPPLHEQRGRRLRRSGQWSNPTKGRWWIVGEENICNTPPLAQTRSKRQRTVFGACRLFDHVNREPTKPISISEQSESTSKCIHLWLGAVSASFFLPAIHDFIKISANEPQHLMLAGKKPDQVPRFCSLLYRGKSINSCHL